MCSIFHIRLIEKQLGTRHGISKRVVMVGQVNPENPTTGIETLSPNSVGALSFVGCRRKLVVFQRPVNTGLVKGKVMCDNQLTLYPMFPVWP